MERKIISNRENTKINLLLLRYCMKNTGNVKAVIKPAPPPGNIAPIEPVETKKLYKNNPGKYNQNIR